MSDSDVAKKLQSMSTRAFLLIIRIKTSCCVLFSQSNKEFTLIYPLNASALNKQRMLLKQSRNTLYNL